MVEVTVLERARAPERGWAQERVPVRVREPAPVRVEALEQGLEQGLEPVLARGLVREQERASHIS